MPRSKHNSSDGGNRTAHRQALIDPAHFVVATRDSGYKTTALAVAEFIDNALQAAASRIAVEIVAAEDAEFPIELRVTDNGVGMDAIMLGQALVFGGSSRFNDRSSLGRYGMGLPNGSLSQARRVEIYTWRDDTVLTTYLDVDELVGRQRRSLPPVVAIDRPSFVPSTPTGTTIRLLRCDRLRYRRPATLARKLTESLGRLYRTFLGRELELLVNGAHVRAIDPLFLDHSSGSVVARQYGDVLRYRLTAAGGTGHVEVSFSELPIEHWHHLSAQEKRRRGITNAPIVSVLRAGREIDQGWLFMGSKRKENYDDWWRCEVRFDPVLDELFGITHSKQGVTPTRELLDMLVPDLEPIARALNRRVRERFELIKIGTPLSAAEQQAARADKHLPALPERTDVLVPEIEELLTTVAKGAPEGCPYHLTVSELPTTAAFEAGVRNGQLLVVLNHRHPLFRDLYGPLAASEIQRDQEVATRVALTLLAAARAEYLSSRTKGADDARRFRHDWSDVLATFMNA